VYSANGADAHTVIVDGGILVRDGQVTQLDVARIRGKCEETGRRLVAGVAGG